jgi:hypothetical protein
MDTSCGDYANVMSCDAQIQLAKREVQNNMYLTDYMVNHPVCSRMNSLMDRDVESAFLHSLGSSKKMCIEKTPHFNNGPWAEQFQTLLGETPQESRNMVIYTKYDQWTRAKTQTKCQ